MFSSFHQQPATRLGISVWVTALGLRLTEVSRGSFHALNLMPSTCGGNLRDTPQGRPSSAEGYGEVWNSMFSSTESCAGVPEGLSPLRVAITRKPLEPELTSTA